MQVLLSIFLSCLLIAFVNLGITQFYPRPDCNIDCILNDNTCTGADCKDNICAYQSCSRNQDAYENNVFYILAIVGLICIIIGFLVPGLIAQITGLSTGFILIIEGMIRNNRSTLTLFITSALLIAIVIGLIYKFSRRKK